MGWIFGGSGFAFLFIYFLFFVLGFQWGLGLEVFYNSNSGCWIRGGGCSGMAGWWDLGSIGLGLGKIWDFFRIGVRIWLWVLENWGSLSLVRIACSGSWN